MEYSPPPLFKQGASARAKMMLFALIAVGLLMADARLKALASIRQAVGAALYPVQVVAMLPRDAFFASADYFTALSTLKEENRQLREQQVLNAQQLQQSRQLLAENSYLRKLLEASQQVQLKTVMSEILYDARDPFSRKVIIDRGARHGIQPGQPVIDDLGVIGQVTRVFPFTSEITLLTDKEHAIPVQVLRSGVRSVAYGRGQTGELELRFMASNADIQVGDVLTTSGIDGVYPAGLAVATVMTVDTKTSDAFARILCKPTAGVSRHRQLLVLLGDPAALPPPPPDESTGNAERSRRARKEAAE
jgi:rod shape-determining protein MreC